MFLSLLDILGAYNCAVRDIMPLYNAAKGGRYQIDIFRPSDLSLPDTENITIYGKLSYKEKLICWKKSLLIYLYVFAIRLEHRYQVKFIIGAGYNKPIIVVLDGGIYGKH